MAHPFVVGDMGGHKCLVGPYRRLMIFETTNTRSFHPQINYLHEGVKLALDEQLEKHSDVLGRNAVSICFSFCFRRAGVHGSIVVWRYLTRPYPSFPFAPTQVWTKKNRISRLPRYLCVQFLRYGL